MCCVLSRTQLAGSDPQEVGSYTATSADADDNKADGGDTDKEKKQVLTLLTLQIFFSTSRLDVSFVTA